MLFDLTDKVVWVAGQHGMVGGAIMRRLRCEPCHLLGDPGRSGLDLRCQSAVQHWMKAHRPQVVFLSAGRVGGIHANNTLPANFLYDNLLIAANIIDAAYQTGVQKLVKIIAHCRRPPADIAAVSGSIGRLEVGRCSALTSERVPVQALLPMHATIPVRLSPRRTALQGDRSDS